MQNRFEKIEKQHVRATKIIKNIPKSVERNRTLEKAGWDPIIYICKRRVAIEVHKIMNEEDEHRLRNVVKISRIKEDEIAVPRLSSELQRRTFNYREILICNELSVNVKQANNKQITSKKLKADK